VINFCHQSRSFMDTIASNNEQPCKLLMIQITSSQSCLEKCLATRITFQKERWRASRVLRKDHLRW